MKIVKLLPSKNIADRYYVDFEDGTTVRANVNIIADLGLFTGRDMSEEEITLFISLLDRAIENMKQYHSKEVPNPCSND